MTNNDKTPMSHWLIAGAALIWNLFGLMVFISTVTAAPEDLAAVYAADEIDFIESIPVWATAANAIAVLAGVLGCLLLLLRRSLAMPMFIVSFIALIVQNLHSFVLEDVIEVFGMVPAYIQLAVMIIAIALILYTMRLSKQGMLK
ncbi:MAG: hypothetical protein AAFX10_01125 [Pseudomonadota bacterium]